METTSGPIVLNKSSLMGILKNQDKLIFLTFKKEGNQIEFIGYHLHPETLVGATFTHQSKYYLYKIIIDELIEHRSPRGKWETPPGEIWFKAKGTILSTT